MDWPRQLIGLIIALQLIKMIKLIGIVRLIKMTKMIELIGLIGILRLNELIKALPLNAPDKQERRFNRAGSISTKCLTG